MLPVLMDRVKDRKSMQVKLACERALLYILRLKKDPEKLESYVRPALCLSS